MKTNSFKVHLVCTAHLDPVWLWSWEEGLREAISTFRTAVNMLDEFPEFEFNHNESLLYEWVKKYDPPLFKKIQLYVLRNRWHIAGGWYQLGNAEMTLGRPGAAVRAYSMARSLNPVDARFALMLGNALQAQGRLAEAMATFREAVALATRARDDGMAASGSFNLGSALIRAGRQPEAEAEFQRALQFDPEHQKSAEALNILGTAGSAR